MEAGAHAMNAGGSSVPGEQALTKLRGHQRAWEVFGTDALKMIPVLQAQLSAVTQETERAAAELMIHLRVLAASHQAGSSADRTESVSKSVVAMQFQDITRQKLEHVGQALALLSRHLHVLLKGPEYVGAQQELAAFVQFEEHYTMEEERRLHQATLAQDYGEPVPTSLSEEGQDSVTLF